jgi:hypothetical protein
MINSSARTRGIRLNTINQGYIYTIVVDNRINKDSCILEIPFIDKSLIGNKVLLTNGVTQTEGIVVRPGYIFFIFNTHVYYANQSTIYILTDKYSISAMKSIYRMFLNTLNDVIEYTKTVTGATLSVSMRFTSDFETYAGTPELSDKLEEDFKTTLSVSLGISTDRIVVTEIKPGSIIINFTILEAITIGEPTPLDLGEEIQFQLTDTKSPIFQSDLTKTIQGFVVDVIVKDLGMVDSRLDFMRDYSIRIYEKIINDKLDDLGDIFSYLEIILD